MKKTFNWCIIGTGKLAKKIANAFKHSSIHKLVAVYSHHFEKAQKFAKKFSCDAYQNVLDAINDKRVDGVYVVTPHNSHFEYAKLALENKKPVLCEKPICVNYKDANKLYEIAKENDVYLAEAMWTWFSPVSHQVKMWVKNGELGNIQKFSACFHVNTKGTAKRLIDPNLAGGALLDICIYPIYYCYSLFGYPKKISCKSTLENGIDLDDYIDFEYDDLVCKLSASIHDWKGLETLYIKGEKASIKQLVFHGSNSVTLKKSFFNRKVFKGDGSYLNEFNLVVKEIRNGKKESEFVTKQMSLDVMKLMDECRSQIGLVYPFEK